MCSETYQPQEEDQYRVKFIVVDNDVTLLLGHNACTQMGLITVNQDEFKRVNSLSAIYPTTANNNVLENKLGQLPGVTHFEVDPSVPTLISPIRKKAVHIKPRLKEAVDNFTKKDVISPVDRPTDWLNHLVCTFKKNDKRQLCLDPKHLNKRRKGKHYYLPVLGELLPDIANAKVFSTFDLRYGY